MNNIEIKKDKIKLSFDKYSGDLKEISYKNNTMEFSKSIWNVETGNGDAYVEQSITDMSEFNYSLHESMLEMIWSNENIRVTVNISAAGGDFKWNITAESLAEGEYISKVVFPVLGGIKQFKKAQSGDYLLLPWQNGCLVKNPLETLLSEKTEMPFYYGRGKEKYENDYPSQYSFQFAAYYTAEDYGYYFATEDPEVYFKTMGFYKNENGDNFDFAITNYPEHIGETKLYTMPYSFVLDFFQGDWQIPAKKYRKWAIEQKWCKGTLQNKNLPDNLQKTDLWVINYGDYEFGAKTNKFYDLALKLKEKLGFNIALHWYGWNKGEFDVDYPEYISEEQKAAGLREELKDYNVKFSENGVVKIPYINARLWDIYTKSWKEENARASALKDENMELFEEPWKNNTLRPMCPATELWSEKVIGFCSDYIMNLGFDGLYMDQVASFNSTLCFDKTHGHPIGGGRWWNDSYHKIMDDLRGIVGADKVLTTESCCETYIDTFDLFLVMDTDIFSWGFNSVLGHENCQPVPLFNMIYGDYALSYGAACSFKDELKLFEYRLIRNLLWGVLPTLAIVGATAESLENDSADGYMNVLDKALFFYNNNKDLFLRGRLIQTLEEVGENIELTLERKDRKLEKSVPSVVSVLWADKLNKQYYLVYNFGERTETIMLDEPTEILPGKLYMIEK